MFLVPSGLLLLWVRLREVVVAVVFTAQSILCQRQNENALPS